jgi:DNA polymerase III subunit epsilon
MKGRKIGESMDDLEALASRLAASPDYRVLRRLDPAYGGGPKIRGGSVRRAAIVDVETTGLDSGADQIIELGVVVFEYGAATGQVGPVVSRYSGLEDPGRPIPPESTAIHHITDEMVGGKRLDDAAIGQLLNGVGLVIAHNANFDRPFLETRLPFFADLHWGCSILDMPWKVQGYSSLALEFLAYRAGFFYDAHRAEIDCLAVLKVLAGPIGETTNSALHALLESARQTSFRVAALGSPFESKDALKARGYRWNSEDKIWVGEVGAAKREAELAWLKEAVYEGKSVEVEIEMLTAKQRYSDREGKKERVRI